jgi:CMP-N,N'-diacetyllegionaminic acid synthase
MQPRPRLMRVLGLIPARGGSRGIPQKNVRLLGGKPLLQHTMQAALAASGLSRVVLSTEDEEIAALGLQCGVDVPFRRPPALAQDDTPMLPVVLHAVSWLEGVGDRFDAVCVLQPTHPLRRPEHVAACIELLDRSGADAVVTVLRVPPAYNPHWVYFIDDVGHLHLALGDREPIARRQELPTAFHREGSVYVARRDVVVEQRSMYGERLVGYELDAEQSVNIDGWEDWERAERLLAERIANVP